MQLLRSTMRVVCAWPSKEVGDIPKKYERIGAYYMVCFSSTYLVMVFLFLKDSVGKMDFFELGHIYITSFMNVVSVTRNCLIFQKAYRQISSVFVKKIHLYNRKDESEYAMKTHLFIHKICHFMTSYLLIAMIIGIVLFNVVPVLHNINKGAYSANRAERNITLEHAVYLKVPFDYTTDFKGYFIVFFFNWYISLTCSVLFCAFDLYLSIFVLHVWGNLKILTYNLEHFPRPSCQTHFIDDVQIEWYSEKESRQVFLRLRGLTKHHSLIINFVVNMSKTFGVVLFVYMGFHLICGCVLLLECSAMNLSSALRYGPLTIILFHQLIQISVIFELLGTTTNSLLTAAYNVPWECMEVSNRRIVHIMLRQSQLPLSTKALDMVDVGCGTMVNILKASLSYFVMLKTFSTED